MEKTETNPRIYGWARGVAGVTLAANVAMWVVPFMFESPGSSPSSNFGPAAFWFMALGATAGLACLLAVVLTMEYRVRSKGSGDPRRKKKLAGLWLLLTPTLLHVIAAPPFFHYMFTH